MSKSSIDLDIMNLEHLLRQRPGVEWLTVLDMLKAGVERRRVKFKRAKDKTPATWSLWFALIELRNYEALLREAMPEIMELLDKHLEGDDDERGSEE